MVSKKFCDVCDMEVTEDCKSPKAYITDVGEKRFKVVIEMALLYDREQVSWDRADVCKMCQLNLIDESEQAQVSE